MQQGNCSQVVSKACVLRYFVSREITKPGLAVSELTAINAIAADVEFISRLRLFAAQHDTDNPVYTWTGLNRHQHYNSVVRWVRRDAIGVREVFSKGINRNVNDSLNAVDGNLAKLATLVPTDEKLSKEFNLLSVPLAESDRIIIGVVQPA